MTGRKQYHTEKSYFSIDFEITNGTVRENYTLNMFVPKTNKAKFGTKILKNLAPKLWTSLPLRIKTAGNLDIFKDLNKMLGSCFL